MTAIDISYYQHHPDFAQVKAAGVTLVIMKCGGGEGGALYGDSVYAANRAAARAQGLAVGSYFFNGPVDPVRAADFQFSIIDWQPGDVVAIDVENNGSNVHWSPAQVLAWCQRILAHGVPADRILVYMSSSVTQLRVRPTDEAGSAWLGVVALGVGLWVAQYGPNDGNPHGSPSIAAWPAWSLWQYTSARGCPGIVGNVDTNEIAPTWASDKSTRIIPTPSKLEEQDDDMKIYAPAAGGAWVVGGPGIWRTIPSGYAGQAETVFGPHIACDAVTFDLARKVCLNLPYGGQENLPIDTVITVPGAHLSK